MNNTILTGARRSDGYLGALRMSSRYHTLPRRERPPLANNVIGVLERPWPVCRVVRASVSNVVVKGTTCSASDASGPVDLDPRGRPTADSTLQTRPRADPSSRKPTNSSASNSASSNSIGAARLARVKLERHSRS